jgi:FkbM family methyltransferase
MKQLIFDVGFNDGKDTAFYLSKGYKVIAVDANPLLIKQGINNFKKEIQNQNLILLNYGISDKAEKLEFYINTKIDVWSSFIKLNGERQDENSYSINIDCIPLSDLIWTYGVPLYIKIDIEGYDCRALESLKGYPACLPQYISVESSEEKSIHVLSELGYKKFKFISQGNVGNQSNSDWTFLTKSGTPSGRFGEETPGEWLTKEEIISLFRNTSQVTDWFDFHAKF